MFCQQDANIHGQGNQELTGIVPGHSIDKYAHKP